MIIAGERDLNNMEIASLHRRIARRGADVWALARERAPHFPVRYEGLVKYEAVMREISHQIMNDREHETAHKIDATERDNTAIGLLFGAQWNAEGRPVMRLSQDLLTQTVLTSYDGVQTSDFKFPFSAFVLDLTGGDKMFAVRDEARGFDDEIVSAMVSLEERASDAICATISNGVNRSVQEITAIVGTLTPPLGLDRCVAVTLLTRRAFVFSFVATMPRDEATPLRSWFYDVLPAIKARLPDTGVWVPRIRSIMDVLAGLAMRLKDDSAKEFNPVRHAVLARKAAPKFDPVVWNFGSKIVVEPRLAAAARARCHGAESAEWTKYASHVVIGHWKRQHSGPGRSKCERIHVASYMRGNREVEPREHEYAVR